MDGSNSTDQNADKAAKSPSDDTGSLSRAATPKMPPLTQPPSPPDSTAVAEQPDDHQFNFIPEEEVSTAGHSSQPSHLRDEETITWMASEFIAHHKSVGWYVGFASMAVVLAIVVFLLTHDVVAAGAIVLVGAALTIFGARQPRQLEYSLSNDGLEVANRYFPFDSFRSFAVIDEGALRSVVFMPLKRFGQIITIYFDPSDEERIISLLADRLPIEDKRLDPIDRLMKRLRF